MNNMAFTPVEGLLNKTSFPSNPSSEDNARQQIQTPLNQLRDYINTNVVDFFNNGGSIGNKLEIVDKSKPNEFHRIIPDSGALHLQRWVNGEFTFAQDVMFGGYSKNTNGYTKLPNGMILQWGMMDINPTSGTQTFSITFPIAFPSTCFNIQCTTKTPNDYSNAKLWRVFDTASSKTGIDFRIDNTGGGTIGGINRVQWIAIGY